MLYDMAFNYYYILGAVFVICGFVLMALFESETLGPKMTNKYLKMKICRKNEEEEFSDDEMNTLVDVGSNKS